MIPSLPQAAAALYGAWRLLRFDREGLQYFEAASAGAFWRSFFAAVLIAPGYAILVALHLAESDVAAGAVSTFTIHVLAYVISWTAFPLVVHSVAQGLGRADHWVGFVIALNWSKVLQMAIYLPIALLAASGALGLNGPGLATLLGLTAILIYQWFVTRSALDITGPQAAGLTGLDVVLGITITAFADAAVMG